MWSLLLRLLFAHVLSDFVFQTDALVQKKEKIGKEKYFYLFLHSLIHSITAYVCVGMWSNYVIPLVVLLTHFVIDLIKILIKNNTKTFLLDQFLHFAVLLLLALCLTDSFNDFAFSVGNLFENQTYWIYGLAYVVILKPTSVFLSLFIKKWSSESGLFPKSLPSAGQWIGYFERILVLTFIFTGNPEGIGFLLAAKSIFRFGELRNSKEITITEYVLIGTLSSFTIAIVVGYIASWLIATV